MGDRVAFILPDSLEEALWSIPVWMQYLEDRLITGREVISVSIASKFEELHKVLAACWDGAAVVKELSEEQKKEVDLIFEFNAATSYSVTKAVEKHIVSSFGILLGTEPFTQLPPIANPTRETIPGLVLIVGRSKLDSSRPWVWDELESFGKIALARGAPIDILDDDAPWEEILKRVGAASVVVGLRGTATLVAVIFDKIVVELYPNDYEHKDWMSKPESKKYREFYGPLERMSGPFIWQKTEELVKDLAGRQKS